MINVQVAAMLNEHIPAEMLAHHTYLRAALDANRLGLFGCEAWLRQQSLEEREHMTTMLTFLSDFDQSNTVPEADAIPYRRFASAEEIFTSALTLERQVTREIGALMRASLDANDFETYDFLTPFMHEQSASEIALGDILARLACAGSNLLEFDEYLETLAGG